VKSQEEKIIEKAEKKQIKLFSRFYQSPRLNGLTNSNNVIMLKFELLEVNLEQHTIAKKNR